MSSLARPHRSPISRWGLVAFFATVALACTQGGELKEGFAPPTEEIADSVVMELVVLPDAVSMTTAESAEFTVYGITHGGDSTAAAVVWEASGGSVTSAGVFTAAMAGTYWVKARGNGNGWGPGGSRRADSSRVTVASAPPVLTGVVLSPSSVTLPTGASQQFSVVGQYSDGSVGAVSASYSATGGSITGGGRYTAGGTAGTYRVIAAAQGDLADTAEVTVTAVPAPTLTAIVLSPPQVTLPVNATQQFSVVGQYSDGSTGSVTVGYSATGGSVSNGGLYTAGSGTGAFRVIAAAPGGLADTAQVTITAAPPPALTGVVLSPAAVALQTGGGQQFTAVGQYSDGSSGPVSVSYSATGGSITGGGNYTAGGTAGTYRVIAIAQGGSGFADTSAVTITAAPPTLTGVVLTPASVSLQTGATQQFSAVGQYSDGSTGGVGVTFSATGGSVSGGGLYTAGGTAGTYRVIAIAQGGSGFADTSAVTIAVPAPTLTAVVLTPASVALGTGAVQQFAVAGQYSDGSSGPVNVTYNVTGGTMTAGGRYTAGTSAGTYRVIAIAQGGSGLRDTSAVTITAPPAPTLTSVTLSPGSVSLQTGATQQFSTVGHYSDGSTGSVSVSYSATGGTISGGGLYTAGGTAGSNYRVIAASGAVADTSAVTITAPPPPPTLTGVTMTPGTATVQSGSTVQFTTVGNYSDGSTGSVSVSYSATGGTISGGGLYTAGSTAGSGYRVIASSAGFADTSAVTVTAQGQFATPDIMNNFGFEGGSYGPFVEVASGGDHQVVNDPNSAYEGNYVLKNTYNPSMGGWVQTAFLGGHNEWYVRQWFRMEGTNSVDGQQKWTRLQGGSPFTTVGGLYLDGSSFTWSADAGLLNGFISGDESLWSISSVNDGQWHCLEFHFQLNGGPGNLPRVEFWLDNVRYSKSSGAWESGWLVYDGRGQIGGGSLQVLMIHGHQNEPNSRSGITWKDRIAISTQRIGP